jgi:hypothetical protein
VKEKVIFCRKGFMIANFGFLPEEVAIFAQIRRVENRDWSQKSSIYVYINVPLDILSR